MSRRKFLTQKELTALLKRSPTFEDFLTNLKSFVIERDSIAPKDPRLEALAKEVRESEPVKALFEKPPNEEAQRCECPYCHKVIWDNDGEFSEHQADCDSRFLQEYERRHEDTTPYVEDGPDYDGPDEAQEWHDFDPDA